MGFQVGEDNTRDIAGLEDEGIELIQRVKPNS